MSRLSRAVSCVAAIVCLTGTPAFANMGESGASSTEANFVAGREAIEKQDWEGALGALRKAVAADPGNAGIQGYNLLALASLQRVPYDEAAKAYQALPEADRQAAAPTDAVKAALDAMYAAADPLIDSWARFVALSRARNIAAETRDQVLAGLKSVYTTRFAGDVSGLEPLITKLQADYTPKP